MICTMRATKAVVQAEMTAEVVPRIFHSAPSGAKMQHVVRIAATHIAVINAAGDILRFVSVKRKIPKTIPEANPEMVNT